MGFFGLGLILVVYFMYLFVVDISCSWLFWEIWSKYWLFLEMICLFFVKILLVESLFFWCIGGFGVLGFFGDWNLEVMGLVFFFLGGVKLVGILLLFLLLIMLVVFKVFWLLVCVLVLKVNYSLNNMSVKILVFMRYMIGCWLLCGVGGVGDFEG